MRDDLARVEGHPLELELTGLDLGQIEEIVDEDEEVRAGAAEQAHVLALLVVQLRLPEDVRDAEDGVEGSPDLVAHVGEEIGLGATGLLRGLLGDPQRVFGLLALDELAELAAEGLDDVDEVLVLGDGARGEDLDHAEDGVVDDDGAREGGEDPVLPRGLAPVEHGRVREGLCPQGLAGLPDAAEEPLAAPEQGRLRDAHRGVEARRVAAPGRRAAEARVVRRLEPDRGDLPAEVGAEREDEAGSGILHGLRVGEDLRDRLLRRRPPLLAAPLGDVPEQGCHEAALADDDGAERHLQRDLAAVLPPALDLDSLDGVVGLGDRRRPATVVVRDWQERDQAADLDAEHLGRRVAEHLLRRAIEGLDASLFVDRHDAVDCAVEDRTHASLGLSEEQELELRFSKERRRFLGGRRSDGDGLESHESQRRSSLQHMCRPEIC